MIDIDASQGEGGGQVVRIAVALAAVTGQAVRLRSMRARRSRPGLAAQHLTAVRAVAQLCGAAVEGLAIGAQQLVFVPGALRAGEFEFDVGTAGSVPLVLQALLPAMIAGGQRVAVRLTGGTDVWAAPPLDYLAHVLVPLLARLGARVDVRCVRRGYYPRGGGVVEATVEPRVLVPHAFDVRGELRAIRGLAHAANLPLHIAERMRDAARAALSRHADAHIEISALDASVAAGAGGAVAIWAETERTVLGAGRVARRGVRAETLCAEAGEALAADLDAGATVDVHAADQLLVYLALAGGGSYVARMLTLHASTAMALIEQLLPVRFLVTPKAKLAAVEVVPTPRSAV